MPSSANYGTDANMMGKLGPLFMSANYAYEVQRTNHFEVVLAGFPEDFTLSVESTASPSISNETIELAYGNSKVKVAGQATFDDFEITCKDFIDARMEELLYEWRGQVYDPLSDRIGWAQDYKRDGYLHQYAPDGTCRRSWKLLGVWPTTFNGGDFAYDGSDKKLISMTLSVDKAVLLQANTLDEIQIPINAHDSKGNFLLRGDNYASLTNTSGDVFGGQ